MTVTVVQVWHMRMCMHDRQMLVTVLMTSRCLIVVRVGMIIMVPVGVVVFMIVLDREVLMFVRVRAPQHEGDTDRGDQE